MLPSGNKFQFGEQEFHFSVATTGLELMTGLKGVRDLGEFHGMLFDFGSDVPVMMTPRGLLFSVDVAFISENGTVLQIERLDPNLGFMQSSRARVRYALEVPIDFFESHNISVGSVLDL